MFFEILFWTKNQPLDVLLDEKYRSRLTDFSAKMLITDTPREVVKFLLSVDLGVSLRPKTFVDLPVVSS